MDSGLKKWNKNNISSFFALWNGFWFSFSELILVFSSSYFIMFVALFYIQPQYLQYTFLISLVVDLIIMTLLKYDMGMPVVIAKIIGSILVLALFIGKFLFPDQNLIIAFSEKFRQVEAIVNKSGSIGVMGILSWVLMLAIPLYVFLGTVFLADKIGKWLGTTTAKIFFTLGLVLLAVIWFAMDIYFKQANFNSIADSHAKLFGYLIGISLVGVHSAFLINQIQSRWSKVSVSRV